jgi:hypothetical protein
VPQEPSRSRDLRFAGDKPDCWQEAGRPTGCQQLLRVRTGARGTGTRQLNVEMTIVAARGTAVSATGGVAVYRTFSRWAIEGYLSCSSSTIVDSFLNTLAVEIGIEAAAGFVDQPATAVSARLFR